MVAVDCTSDWHPASWQDKGFQQPGEASRTALQKGLDALAALPPLVTSWEVRRLKHQLAEAAHEQRFLLQGGTCAGPFASCTPEGIARRLKVLLQMSLVLGYGLKMPVIRVERCAGPYAAVPSGEESSQNMSLLPGDQDLRINGTGHAGAAQELALQRMLAAYSRSALSMNFVRSLVGGGFVDLDHPEYWELEFINQAPYTDEYRQIVEAVGRAVSFVETVSGQQSTGWVDDIFTSHEMCLLPYEQAQTRQVPHNPGWYNLTAHMPWLGRQAVPEGPHAEYARGVANPIGVIVGSEMTPDRLQDLIQTLDDDKEPGRLTLITCFGVDRIEADLPPLIQAVERTGRRVGWCIDPIRGNADATGIRQKTRQFDSVLAELELAFDIHAAMRVPLGGVHFELIADEAAVSTDAEPRSSKANPGLNGAQALEMAFCIVRKCRQREG